LVIRDEEFPLGGWRGSEAYDDLRLRVYGLFLSCSERACCFVTLAHEKRIVGRTPVTSDVCEGSLVARARVAEMMVGAGKWAMAAQDIK